MVQLPGGVSLHQLRLLKADRGLEIDTQLGLEGRPHVISLAGDERVILKAELVSTAGKVFELMRDGMACPGYNGKCTLYFSSRFPDNTSFSSLRLWSSSSADGRENRMD